MKFKVYDCDRHVIEPLTVWADYVNPAHIAGYEIGMLHDNTHLRTERVNRLGELGDVELPPQYLIGNDIILADWSEEMQLACAHKDAQASDNTPVTNNRFMAMQPNTQLASMDSTHISRASLLPTFATFIINHEQIPASVSLAYASAYNRWLLDYAAADPKRLNPVALLSRHDPTSLVSQLQTALAQGFTSVMLRPEPIKEQGLGAPEFAPFWQRCEAENVAVIFHGGTHLHAPTVGRDRFQSHFALHACSHPHEIQMAFLALLESGVLERHPQLKFGFLEAGCSWLPHWLWRLDHICYPEFPGLTQDKIKMKPSEYFKRQCWVSLELEEPCIAQVIDMIGHKNLVFASDFPHPDHNAFELSTNTPLFQQLTEQQMQDILFNNAMDLYHGRA